MTHRRSQHEWQLDELAHAGPEHLDAQYVAGYDRKAGYDPDPDVATMVAHGLGSKSVLVDLGAGTGQLALAAASVCGQVIAVDISPAMVSVLRDRAEAAGVKNLVVVQGGLLSYEHDGPPVDFVYSRNALHHLPDFWKGVALSRIRALLAPGGILRLHDLVFDFEPADADEWIAEWLSGAVDDPARGWTPDELAEHVREEHSTYSWLFEPMLERTGFDILERGYIRGAYGAYTCRRR